MAIQFARAQYVSRSTGGNACCKGAYNAREKIKDEKINTVYNFQKKDDNVYHEILLPDHVDKKFKSIEYFMNEIEKTEIRKNSQLMKEYVLALPDEKNISLEIKKEMIHEFVKENKWIEEGLGVQIDIHKPHNDENNWHAHLLVTTRRFTEDGLHLGKKARDLEPEVRDGKRGAYINSKNETNIGDLWAKVQNSIFEKHGFESRVDEISAIPEEHIGPKRMRSILNEAMQRNEERKASNRDSLETGADLLDRVTKNSSVFTKKDLIRSVKCIEDQERASSLVDEALKAKSIIKLYNADGSFTDFYTTQEVRKEELKLKRLGRYVFEEKNIFAKAGAIGIAKKLIKSDESLKDEERKTLSHLILENQGMRVLQGRAGTGKSYVLSKIPEIAETCGIDIIGLAPTHKAKVGLIEVGYNKSDTIKGFLFNLYNGRSNLEKNTLIVVDEAGMVSNSDYTELLRVAVSKECNVILAGDDRQLSSIERGGMFSEYAEEFNAYELTEVKRQKVAFGKDVATHFSNNDPASGIHTLYENKRLIMNSTKVESMESLLKDWSGSSFSADEKLIIAVKNKDVDVLNLGAREWMKSKGLLSGPEFFVGEGDNRVAFATGDRIVFKASSKEIGFNNGDFATIEYIDEQKCVARFHNDREIAFNPTEFNNFKHGYASTIYSAQGASIEDVYVFHDGFSTMQSSYVAMSRHVHDIHLYSNEESTKSAYQLITQLGFNPERRASVSYFAEDDLKHSDKASHVGLFMSIATQLKNFAKFKITKIIDKNNVDSEYYSFKKPQLKQETVEAALARDNVIVSENDKRMAVNDNIKSSINNENYTKQDMSFKDRFYANRDFQQNRKQSLDKESDFNEMDRLRDEVKFKSEAIARELLGEPNERLSNNSTLRYGEHGRLAIQISGERSGNWYDFSANKGGDLFSLVQEQKNCDFKEAVSYLASSFDVNNSPSLKFVHEGEIKDKYIDHYKNQNKDKAQEGLKSKRVEKLYERSILIQENSVAKNYLSKTRNIDCELSQDIKTIKMYNKELNKKIDSIVSFARDSSGKITGGQQLFLNNDTNSKADISIPRKSFGTISGSFVDVSNPDKSINKHNITIIAEGIETALSIKESIPGMRVVCSLGISNIKNYTPKPGERIILAADNDGPASQTNLVIDRAKEALEQGRSSMVEVVRPERAGDFNDILMNKGKAKGIEEIKEIFTPIINKYALYTNEQVEIIAHNERYEVKNTNIEDYLRDHNQVQASLLKFNPDYDMEKLKTKLAPFNDSTKKALLQNEQHTEFNSYTSSKEQYFANQKTNSKSLEELLQIHRQEREFVRETYKDHSGLLNDVKSANNKLEIHTIDTYMTYKNNPNLIEDYEKDVRHGISLGITKSQCEFENLKLSNNLHTAHNTINNKCQAYHEKELKNDIKTIETHNSLEKNGIKFTDAKSYLQESMKNQDLKGYISRFANQKITEIDNFNQEKLEHTNHLQMNRQPQKVREAKILELEQEMTM